MKVGAIAGQNVASMICGGVDRKFAPLPGGSLVAERAL
jgi:hypothetical protein